jgi:hypothetical protein
VKDLDFDEIDRAVNSLKSSSPAENENTDNSNQPTDDSRSTDSSESMPTLVKKRSSGQFMDVVHPSSNMRKAPLISHDRPSNPELKPVDSQVIESSSESVGPPQIDNSEKSHDDEWPDPIDFHNKNHKNDQESDQYQNEDSDIDQINDDITNELNHESDELPDKSDMLPEKSDEMPESPFIAGTKVEKRPLGAFSNDSVPESEKNEEVGKVESELYNDTVSKENTETIEKNITTETTEKTNEPLPEELQDDLLLIESGEGEASTSPVEQKSAETESKAEPELKKVETPEVEKQPVAPVSITQQYKEHPSTGDQSTGAIYNTDAYHKPLVKPANKKSSWMWIVWIIILIILGVGVGVAVNQFVLPLL